MMGVATDFALVGLNLIQSPARRAQVMDRLTAHGRILIDLDFEQVCNFAGNAIELHAPSGFQEHGGRILALSRRAANSLRPDQLAIIERSCTLLPLDIPTIELAGGSVRCMIAGIHLDPRPVVIAA